MGKKGSWFSAIKRVFTHSSKDKPTNRLDKKGNEEKKKGKGILGAGKSKSLIPLFREPSSIEKILGEADQLLIRPISSTTNTTTNTIVTNSAITSASSSTSPVLPARTVSSSTTNTNTIVTNSAITSASSSIPPVLPIRTVSPIVLSPKSPSSPSPPPPLKPLTSGVPSSSSFSKASVPKAITEDRKEIRNVPRVEPTLRDQHLSATKIQTAFRGYMGRRSFRALKGLVRLQEVVRGQNVKRQTANAMKQLQLMVKVQTQIQSRRIQMFENQRQQYRNHYKELESTLGGKWINQSSENEDWDDSLLTKEEVDSRLQKKVEAAIKRERAMAYAYSHKLWSDHPKSAHSPVDTRFNGFPRWWNWPTPSRAGPTSDSGQGPHHIFNSSTPKDRESQTPRSSRSAAVFVGPSRARRPLTPTGTRFPTKDDDSLVSCPPFSLPSYMGPTVSARAKARASSNPRERFIGTPDSSQSTGRRFSFPLTPIIGGGGGFGWGGVGLARGSGAGSGMGKDELARSVGEFSVGSAVSMPAMVGRKPFNRFV